MTKQPQFTLIYFCNIGPRPMKIMSVTQFSILGPKAPLQVTNCVNKPFPNQTESLPSLKVISWKSTRAKNTK